MIVAIPTRDRPEALRYCLRSIQRDLCRSPDSSTILVVDTSTGVEADQSRRVADAAMIPGRDVVYVGSAEQRRLCSALIADGVPSDLARFALGGGGYGANRNLISLLTAGAQVVMVDDDVVLQAWGRTPPSRAIHFARHDCRRRRWFTERAEALRSIQRSAASVCAAHVALLGARFELGGDGTVRRVCGDDSRNQTRAAVRLTLAGLAGDSGLYCPYRLLLPQGPGHPLRGLDDRAVARALRYREVTVISDGVELTRSVGFMAYCAGFDNTQRLPPFVPIGTNEDGAFAALLALTDKCALTAHLPIGVIHNSSRAATYDDGQMRSARETRLADIMTLLMLESAPTSCPDLLYVGNELIQLSLMPTPQFIRRVRDVAISRLRAGLQMAEHCFPGYSGSAAPHWHKAFRQYALTLRRHLERADYVLPIEFLHRSGELAPERLRRVVSLFGRLCCAWPDIWARCRRAGYSLEPRRLLK